MQEAGERQKFPKKKIISAAIAVVFVVVILIFLAARRMDDHYFGKRIFPAVLVSDIHLGSEKCEWDQCGPKIEEAFRHVLDNTGDAMIITAGDNTDASAYSDDQERASALREGYKARLLEMTAGREVIWANGNHDRQTYVGGEEYFSREKNGWKFIVIRTTKVEGSQLDWLKEELKSDKKKIVIMHHPVFHQRNKNVMPQYGGLVDLFRESGVKMVLSGHWHGHHYERELDGVVYKALRGLTYLYNDNGKAHFEILELDYRMIDIVELDPHWKTFIFGVHRLFER